MEEEEEEKGHGLGEEAHGWRWNRQRLRREAHLLLSLSKCLLLCLERAALWAGGRTFGLSFWCDGLGSQEAGQWEVMPDLGGWETFGLPAQ